MTIPKIVKVTFIDKDTHEFIEEVGLDIQTEIVEIIVATKDAENTKITVVTTPEE